MTNSANLPRGVSEKILLSKICKSASERLDQCLGSGARRLCYAPCVFTKLPVLRPKGNYGDLSDDPYGAETVATFEKTFSITDGGITLPKIVVCVGSRGGRYKQLVKGHDEVRQDAVMQQVFGYVNELMGKRRSNSELEELRNSRSTSKMRFNDTLKVVTYHIVPLSPASGVSKYCRSLYARAKFFHAKLNPFFCA